MKHQAFATRTKTDRKEVLVAESNTPIDVTKLKERLYGGNLVSEEFDETSRVRVRIVEDEK